jgi:hypothetical protein
MAENADRHARPVESFGPCCYGWQRRTTNLRDDSVCLVVLFYSRYSRCIRHSDHSRSRGEP